MLNSLRHSFPEGPFSADVCVIGAGLAGLALAQRLAHSGIRVAVLESGSSHQSEDVHPLNAVEMLGQLYQGAEQGRFRCLGGTSTRWGGALLTYLNGDLKAHPCDWHSGWGISPNELDKHITSIERDFGVAPGTYEADAEVERCMPSFLPRSPKWPRFKNRSTANIFRSEIQKNSNLQVWTDATTTEIRLDTGRARGVVAKCQNGNSLRVDASQVVIAAGAIETTRLLLLLDRAHSGAVFAENTPLGKGFHDHLSASIGGLEAHDWKELTRLFSFRFVPGGMRNVRFELSFAVRERRSLPGAFLHVAFSRKGESGFDGLRRVYQSLQRRDLPALSDIGQTLADAPWFARAVWWRFIEQRVLPPTGSSFELHLVTEQKPESDNRIGLSETASDPFGLPLATINWSIGEEDVSHFQKIARLALQEWRRGPLNVVASIKPRREEMVREAILGGGGIYHPAGTTRIGPDASVGVVDSHLRVHGVPGLWALATSVFPSVGGSSPSLALLQLAVRAAEDIGFALQQKA